jgi:hypothetical protein
MSAVKAPPPEPVSPRPGLPKTIGVVNLLLGGLLLLCGAGYVATFVPFLVRNDPFQLDPNASQAAADEFRRGAIAELAQQENAARNKADKERLRAARNEIESKSGKLAGQVDFAKINAGLPWLSRYFWVDVVTGPILSIPMLVAGFGLVRLREWGRKLALWVAGLQLARIVVLSALLGLVAIPRVVEAAAQFAKSDAGEAFIRSEACLILGSDPHSRSPALSGEDFARILAAIGNGFTLLSLGFRAIYPVIVLVVLTRAGARAACAARPG